MTADRLMYLLRRQGLIAALIILILSSVGCAIDEAHGDETSIEQTAPEVLPVYGGYKAPPVGVVAITMGNGYECSGVMIAENGVLTAAHCLRSSGVGAGATRDVQASIVFTKADGRLVCLTDSAPVRPNPPRVPQCASLATYRASVLPFADVNEPQTDLAILRWGRPFNNISYTELAYIALSEPSDTHLEFHGYGYQNDARTMGGAPRSRAAELGPLIGTFKHHISLSVANSRPCIGDSGGPLTVMYAKTSPYLFVLGIISTSDAKFKGCPPSRSMSHFTRLKPNLGFIERMLGVTCTRGPVLFNENKSINAARCFGKAGWKKPPRT